MCVCVCHCGCTGGVGFQAVRATGWQPRWCWYVAGGAWRKWPCCSDSCVRACPCTTPMTRHTHAQGSSQRSRWDPGEQNTPHLSRNSVTVTFIVPVPTTDFVKQTSLSMNIITVTSFASWPYCHCYPFQILWIRLQFLSTCLFYNGSQIYISLSFNHSCWWGQFKCDDVLPKLIHLASATKWFPHLQHGKCESTESQSNTLLVLVFSWDELTVRKITLSTFHLFCCGKPW